VDCYVFLVLCFEWLALAFSFVETEKSIELIAKRFDLMLLVEASAIPLVAVSEFSS
jgi:hypothetical protein